MKQLSIFFAILLLGFLMLLYWLNRVAVDLALTEIFGAVFTGLKIVFFVGLVFGIAWGAIALWRQSQLKVIGAGEHGYQQAIIHKGEVIHLQQPNSQQQLDPLAQMQLFQKFLQVQPLMGKVVQQTQVQEVTPLEIGAPQERIPAVVRYEDVAREVPDDLTLLGIHPSDGNLEIVAAEKLKTVWFVGGSNMGKTNTVYGKVGDCVRWGCKVSICDQHAFKRDGLTAQLTSSYAHAFAHPPAQTDDEIKAAILNFLAEFHRRRAGGSYTDKLLIVVDEVNGLCEHVVRVSREEARMIYERYGVEIKKERIKMRVFIQLLVETCGYESRGFDMFGFFISQKAADLYWLRKAAMTVFVHGLLMKSEALLACNDNPEAAALVMNFKKGRTYIFGYEIERPMELQQPLYGASIVESRPISKDVANPVSQPSPSGEVSSTVEYTIDAPGKQPDTDDTEMLTQAQKMKLLKVLELDAQGTKGQNEIIRTVWGQEPNTRAGNAAAEELRLIRAYIAQDQRKKLGL